MTKEGIEEVTTTVVVEPGWSAKLDAGGSYLIRRRKRLNGAR